MIQGVIFSMCLWVSNRSIYRDTQSVYLNILYVAAVVVFFLYGLGLYYMWKNRPFARKSESNLRRMRRTLIITIIVAISFLIRVIGNILDSFVVIDKVPVRKIQVRPAVEAVFYTIVEVIPMAGLLWLMLASGLVRNKSHTKPLIAQISEDASLLSGQDDFYHSQQRSGDDDDEDSSDESIHNSQPAYYFQSLNGQINQSEGEDYDGLPTGPSTIVY